MRTLGLGTEPPKINGFEQQFFADGNVKPGTARERRLSARTVFEPIQIQDCIGSVSQPSVNFACLKWTIPRAKVAIEQFCNFFGRARPFDLVHRPNDVFVEPVVRPHDLALLR
jgi:hypothetical protein